MSPSVEHVLGFPATRYRAASGRSGSCTATTGAPDRGVRGRVAVRRASTGLPIAIRYATADGGWAWLETVSAGASPTTHGRPVLVSNSRDVTARMRAEEALGETQLRFRETLDTIQVAAITIDTGRRIVYVNDAPARDPRAAPATSDGPLGRPRC